MMIFLNSLDALIPKSPFSFFAEIWVRGTSGAWRSVSVGFWGPPSIEPFFWGGASQRAVSTPPLPSWKPAHPCCCLRPFPLDCPVPLPSARDQWPMASLQFDALRTALTSSSGYLLLGGDWHMMWQLLALPVDEGVPRSQNAIFPAQDVRGLLSLCVASPCSSVGGMVPWEDTLLLALEHADGLVMVQL